MNLIFEDIEVSTKTYIVMTNIKINLQQFYDMVPITAYEVHQKRRGRKRKNELPPPKVHIDNGLIIYITYENSSRGTPLKKKKKKTFFRNSITIIIMIKDKPINFKLSSNGQFQITGCKTTEYASGCIQYIWKLLQGTDVYQIGKQPFTATFIPAMRNIDFNIGFLIDREKLDRYINEHTEHTSLLETSFGYTGVNIKFKMKKDITSLQLKQMKVINNEWDMSFTVPYQYYLDSLKEKDSLKKMTRERYNTFLVFHSGKIIMSGINKMFQSDSFAEFIKILLHIRPLIEEKLIKKIN